LSEAAGFLFPKLKFSLLCVLFEGSLHIWVGRLSCLRPNLARKLPVEAIHENMTISVAPAKSNELSRALFLAVRSLGAKP
jgi:hypothetical protein